MNRRTLPVVVIGAGPVGLAAAAHLLSRGLTPLVLESGNAPASGVAAWSHVRMFSPWRYNLDRAACDLLAASGWRQPPADQLPTAGELRDDYLLPLAAAPDLAPHIRYRRHVVAVGKRGFDRMRSRGRQEAPFEVVAEAGGELRRISAAAVLDASGTWATPNPLGAGGLPATGELAANRRILYRLPDLEGADRGMLLDRRVLIVGSGDSALSAIGDLAAAAQRHPRTQVVWAVRSGAPRFGGDGELPARRALAERARELVEAGRVELVTGFEVRAITDTGGRLAVDSGNRALPDIEVIVAATGFRPDHSLARELRLSLDSATEAAGELGPLIDPALHRCTGVPEHGFEELAHPDFGYFIVGMKSYGRAPTFLLRTGYEQVRSVAAALAGGCSGARDAGLTRS